MQPLTTVMSFSATGMTKCRAGLEDSRHCHMAAAEIGPENWACEARLAWHSEPERGRKWG